MTAIELKHELFRDIESISDESILQKIASYIKTVSKKSHNDKPLLWVIGTGTLVHSLGSMDLSL